jgi:hypothetical protein
MSELIELRPHKKEPPPELFGRDGFMLKMIAQWRSARAQMQKNWADDDEAGLFGFVEDSGFEIDREPFDRTQKLEYMMSVHEPETVLCAQELLRVVVTILAYRCENPDPGAFAMSWLLWNTLTDDKG